MPYNVFTGYNSFVSEASFELNPAAGNSSSISIEPLLNYSSQLELNPETINSVSLSNEPLISYVVTGVLSINPGTANSFSLPKIPVISFGRTQVIGNVTASYAEDLYTANFK